MGNMVLDGDQTAPLRPLTEYPTPLGEYLSSQFTSTLQANADRQRWVQGARPNNTVVGYDYDGNPLYGDDPSQTRVPADQVQSQFEAAGLKMKSPDDGMYQDTMAGLIQRHQEQDSRQFAIANSPTGARSVLGFGVQALTSMLDPINLYTAFVPVIGPAKYTALLAEAAGGVARFGLRAAVGAGEGAVGTALVQPIEAATAKSVGDDYTMTTALQNIAFGTVFGAGLHSIGGATHDLILGAPQKTITTDVPNILPEDPITARAGQQPITIQLKTGETYTVPLGASWMNNNVSHETRIAATSTAVGQMLDGRNIEITPIMRADPNLQYQLSTRQQPTDMAGSLAQARDDITPQLREDLTATAGNVAEPGQVAQMNQQLSQLKSSLDALPDVPDRDVVKGLQSSEKLKYGDAFNKAQAALDDQKVEIQTQMGRLNQALDTNREASQAAQDLATLNGGQIPERYQGRAQQRAEQLLQGDPLTAAIRQLYSTSTEADRAAAQRYNAPENVAVADSDMARAADEHMAAAPEALKSATTDGAEAAMKDAELRFTDTLDGLKRGGASDDTITSLKKTLEPFDEAVKDSDNLAKATRAAAICGLSRG